MTQSINPVSPDEYRIELPSIKSILFSAHFLTAIIGLIILGFLASLASLGSSNLVKPTAVNPQLQQIEQAQNNFFQAEFQIREERGRNDFSKIPQNEGNFQALSQAVGTEINYRVDRQNADPKSSNFAVNKDEVYQTVRFEAMKFISMAAAGQGATLNYSDPATGQKVSIVLSPQELAFFGLFKLDSIGYAQDAQVRKTIDLNKLRRDVASQEEQLKIARAQLLTLTGQEAVAQKILEKDIYGRVLADQLSPVYPVPGAHY